jgi:cysteine desulfurase
VIDPIEWLEKHEGAQLLWLPVDKSGQPDLETYQTWLSQYGDEIALVSLMWVNNETGAIWDIPAMAALANEYGIPVHSDAVAAFGHTEISFKDSNLAAMSVSGHKLGAPIGVGALIVSRSQKPISLIHGGGQERGLRSGTMNYPHALSLAKASELAVSDMADREARLERLRDQLEQQVLTQVPQAHKTISGPRIGHTASFIFPGVQSDSLLFLLDQKGISVSAGSACQAGVLGASHVLLAMGYSEAEASSVLRVTLGHTTTAEDIEVFTSSIAEVYQTALRAGLNR